MLVVNNMGEAAKCLTCTPEKEISRTRDPDAERSRQRFLREASRADLAAAGHRCTLSERRLHMKKHSRVRLIASALQTFVQHGSCQGVGANVGWVLGYGQRFNAEEGIFGESEDDESIQVAQFQFLP